LVETSYFGYRSAWLNPQNVKGHAKRKLIYGISKTRYGVQRDIKILNAADYPRFMELRRIFSQPNGLKNDAETFGG